MRTPGSQFKVRSIHVNLCRFTLHAPTLQRFNAFVAIALLVGCASTADVTRQPGRNGATSTPTAPNSTATHSNATPVESNSLVYIEGRDVHKPGAYPWRNGMTMTELIKAADGLSEFGGGSHLIVTHTDGKKQTFMYFNIVSGLAKDPVVRPGDKVSVFTPNF